MLSYSDYRMNENNFLYLFTDLLSSPCILYVYYWFVYLWLHMCMWRPDTNLQCHSSGISEVGYVDWSGIPENLSVSVSQEL